MSDSALKRLREKVDQIVRMEKDIAHLGLRGEQHVENYILHLHASVWAEAVIAAHSITVGLPETDKTL